MGWGPLDRVGDAVIGLGGGVEAPFGMVYDLVKAPFVDDDMDGFFGTINAVTVSRTGQLFKNLMGSDTGLGAITYDLASWPTTPRHLSFTFDLPHAATVGAGHRLVLALSARGESDNDLVLLYDHPVYPSFLQVATTTPL